jgi:hypothetical protein
MHSLTYSVSVAVCTRVRVRVCVCIVYCCSPPLIDEISHNKQKALSDADFYRASRLSMANQLKLSDAFLKYEFLLSMQQQPKTLYAASLEEAYANPDWVDKLVDSSKLSALPDIVNSVTPVAVTAAEDALQDATTAAATAARRSDATIKDSDSETAAASANADNSGRNADTELQQSNRATPTVNDSDSDRDRDRDSQSNSSESDEVVTAVIE